MKFEEFDFIECYDDDDYEFDDDWLFFLTNH